jgi:hypothetical protein
VFIVVVAFSGCCPRVALRGLAPLRVAVKELRCRRCCLPGVAPSLRCGLPWKTCLVSGCRPRVAVQELRCVDLPRCRFAVKELRRRRCCLPRVAPSLRCCHGRLASFRVAVQGLPSKSCVDLRRGGVAVQELRRGGRCCCRVAELVKICNSA